MTTDTLFLQCFHWLMVEEGGYSDNPKDHGGATKYGISLRYLQHQKIIPPDLNHDGKIDWQDIKLLTEDQAAELVYEDWWQRYSYGSFPFYIARKILSLSFNMGAKSAHILLQQAVRACSDGDRLGLDGVLGDQTRIAVNKHDPYVLHAALKSEAAGFYRSLVARHPDQVEFLNGWLNRAYH